MSLNRKDGPVILLGLNELNFHFVEAYAKKGLLPNFQRLIQRHGVVRTVSEKSYPELEPWIQWVTVHTGLSFDEHRVFRLGDIVKNELPQIWEVLAKRFGASVAAVSPMNARNSLADYPSALFVPDPWTETTVSAPKDVELLFSAVKQAVNDNAHGRLAPASAARLLVGMLRNVRASSYAALTRLALGAKRRKWFKALLLDRVLADVFVSQVKRGNYDFGSLFLNAGAHIQHHYMFSSPCYEGPLRNPSWYVEPGADPVADVYALYDEILGDLIKVFPDARILVCTGLSQKPNDRMIFYYRPKEHERFLQALGVPYRNVLPRMSRDFLLECGTPDAALQTQRALNACTSLDGRALFAVDNRGSDLFCMLMYTDEITSGFSVRSPNGVIERFDEMVSLVSIENGIHQTTGYLIDTGVMAKGAPREIELKEIYSRLVQAFEPA